ncbi:phosphatase PAP2 family protein [Massilia solisilvae]|uniref:Phosphatase PAP2 family protein n=1 Tax=Massilia solisilvae TaxID=1811225 RepID=A0ABT2BP78_9BURK|nr:phosphatase PAP2 family protein [Massilia solisilvae]MCS0610318.1 phosphatase PAP2 family protein [Massilia solisilvae]
MLEHLNLYLFSIFNAHAGLHGWPLSAALFAAERLILLVPLMLLLLWLGGDSLQRQAAVRAAMATAGALAANAVIGLLWFHPRPFVAGIGHTFMQHAPDSSFPSDHATIMFTVSLVLAFSQSVNARRIGTWLLPVSIVVAWSRVFLGVHYPADMIGALVVALGMLALVNTRTPAALCATLVPAMETVYRRVLAAPIARGWLRP